MTVEIKTDEPIRISAEDGGIGINECYIYVDDKPFVTLHEVHLSEIDETLLVKWIVRNYQNPDFVSEEKIVPRINGKDFLPN